MSQLLRSEHHPLLDLQRGGPVPVEGGGKRDQKCGCCKGKGAYDCTTCKGERAVEPPKLKPSVAEAKAQDLRKALEALAEVQAALDKFESSRDARKDMKAIARVVKPGFKYFPVLKRFAKQFDIATKAQTKGAVWTSYVDNVVAHADLMKRSLDYYLKHQKRVLELSLARAEHNEKVASGKK